MIDWVKGRAAAARDRFSTRSMSVLITSLGLMMSQSSIRGPKENMAVWLKLSSLVYTIPSPSPSIIAYSNVTVHRRNISSINNAVGRLLLFWKQGINNSVPSERDPMIYINHENTCLFFIIILLLGRNIQVTGKPCWCFQLYSLINRNVHFLKVGTHSKASCFSGGLILHPTSTSAQISELSLGFCKT